jgi:hypothetical protein
LYLLKNLKSSEYFSIWIDRLNLNIAFKNLMKNSFRGREVFYLLISFPTIFLTCGTTTIIVGKATKKAF